jgi:hypothetical protein
MRVTFDTNALSDVIAPETSQRGALGAASGKKVRAAIEVDHMQGFFCETLITLEGIKNADRSAVFLGVRRSTPLTGTEQLPMEMA